MKEKSKEKVDGRTRRSWGNNTICNFLLPLMQNKVMTEHDLIRKLGSPSHVNTCYKRLREHGFPIRREMLYSEGLSVGTRSCRRKSNRRMIIYYVY